MLDLVVQQIYFNAIQAGLKTVEGRLGSPKLKKLKAGDTISFTCHKTNEKIWCTIIALNTYSDFKEMLIGEGLAQMLPGIKTIAAGVAIYESFPNYKEMVKTVGALAIKIEPVF